MTVFDYSGIDPSQKSVQGTISAETARQARDDLRERGIRVRKISTAKQSRRPRLPSLTLSSTKNQWTTAVSELSMLLHAGIPMLDALETIVQQSQGSFRAALLGVKEKVAAGESLAAALRGRPDLFDEASIQMVEVGENAGNLEEVLNQLAEFKQRQSRFTDAVTTAMVYPAFLVCFGTAAGVFLMTSVLPPLLENLEETLDELPWPTRVAKTISVSLVDYKWFWLSGILIIVTVFTLAVRTEWGRSLLDRMALRAPVLGKMLVKQNVSRIAMIIGTLSRSGVELTRAFDLAARSIGNTVFRRALADAEKRISAGEEVAEALEGSHAFPPLAVRVFSVGQDSGKLDEMLFRLAEDYDEQVKTASARLTSLIEPVLILVLAAMVGFLLLATILPILEAGNVM